MCSTFHFHYFAKTKFLMLNFLANLQITCITCLEIG